MPRSRLPALLLTLAAGPALAGAALASPGEAPTPAPPVAGAVAPVLGGSDVPEGKWRDTAAVLFGGEQGCTGVLVAPTVVLTAAHCIDSTLDAVLVGTNSLARPGAGETLRVARRVQFPSTAYDLGLLVLEQPSTIPPRRLATGWIQDQIVNNAPVALVGYGAIDRNARTYIDELQEAMTTVTDAGCTDHLGCDPRTRPDGEIGAGGGGIDTCPGDSGGPLYLVTAHGAFLAGITSRGYDNNVYDCSEGGIYVRPDKASVVEWIEAQAGVALEDGLGPRADTLFVQPGGEGTVTVAANDPRAAGSYTWEIVTPPLHGTATIDAQGRLTVVAATDHLGPDVVTVRATDATTPTRTARGRVAIEVVEELPDDGGGCCQASPSPRGAAGRLGPVLLVLAALWPRRRRRTIAR